MLEVAIMLEGQNGLNWQRWQRIARAVEDLGFIGLYRSDHFTNAQPPDIDSLELWVSLMWLASHTQRIEFGSMVAPVSFRDPRMMARIAAAVDDLAEGRLTLGLGAGWQEREHHNWGYDLLDTNARFARFAEALEITSRLLAGETPVDFNGAYYQLRDATILPRPHRPGGPPILIGGNGARRTLPLAARYAREWNAVMLPPAKFRELNGQLDHLIREQGREPAEVRRSMMTNLTFGRDDAELQRRLEGRDAAALRERGVVVGVANAVVEQLGALAEAGVQRIMLQWLNLDDMDGLEAVAMNVVPQLG